jgi:hypothetical protein
MKKLEKLSKIGKMGILSKITEEIDTIRSYFGDYNYVSALSDKYLPNAINRYREARKKAIECDVDVSQFDDIVANLTSKVNSVPLYAEVDFDHLRRMSAILAKYM